MKSSPPASGLNPAAFKEAVQGLLNNKTKPPGSLGQLEELAGRLAFLQKTFQPNVERKCLLVYAASHGVVEENVSAYPAAVTGQMVRNFMAGGAAINVFARHGGINLRVVDVGVDSDLSDLKGTHFFDCKIRRGTYNFLKEPAMSISECEAAIEIGRAQLREAQAEKIQLFGIGEMGIGNTTSASALIAGLGILSPEDSVGIGTGLDKEGLLRKAGVVAKAVELYSTKDPKKWLQRVGGFEIAAMVGTILEAARLSLPIVIDGFIASSAATIAFMMESAAKESCFFGHCSSERPHRKVLEYLNVKPLLDLQMRLGEGTGAALAMHILDASARILCEMASFEDAGVSQKSAAQ